MGNVFSKFSVARATRIPKRSTPQAFAKSVLWFSLRLTDGHSLPLRRGLQRRRAQRAACRTFSAATRGRERLVVDDGDRAASERGGAARPGLARSMRRRGLLP